jgi:hypothetical protein
LSPSSRSKKLSSARNQCASRWQAFCKMEAMCSSEPSVDTQRTTRRYIQEDGTLLFISLYVIIAAMLWLSTYTSTCSIYMGCCSGNFNMLVRELELGTERERAALFEVERAISITSVYTNYCLPRCLSICRLRSSVM